MDKNTPTPNGIEIQQPDKFAIAQALYNTVTGKTEKLIRSFNRSYKITFGEIEQLHFKFGQMCCQWSVLQSSSNIVVNHVDDNKEVFSSVERFKIYDKSRTAPVESVVYEFNVLLKLPSTELAQHYKVTVRMLSRAAAIVNMEEASPGPHWFRLFERPSMIVEIEYVDYVVARNILSMFDSWASQVEFAANPRILNWLQMQSYMIPLIFTLVISTVACASLFVIVPAVLKPNSDSVNLVRFLIAAILELYGSIQIAQFLGQIVENNIDRLGYLSSIQLNKGDERVASTVGRRNCICIVKGIVSLAVTVGLGIAINVASEPVIKLLFH